MVLVSDVIAAIGYKGLLWGFVFDNDEVKLIEHCIDPIQTDARKFDDQLLIATATMLTAPERVGDIWILEIDGTKFITNKGPYFTTELEAELYRDAQFRLP